MTHESLVHLAIHLLAEQPSFAPTPNNTTDRHLIPRHVLLILPCLVFLLKHLETTMPEPGTNESNDCVLHLSEPVTSQS
jgi:hypothetical protein